MSKFEKARQEEIFRHLSNAGRDDGARGRAFELDCASSGSRKTRVSKQGQADVFIHYGKGNYAAECKTNGGRIEALFGKGAPKFVIYQMDITIKHPAGKTTKAREEKRFIEARLIPTEVFLNSLKRFNAIKSTNGKNPERAIQVTSKKFYEWLLDWPITYIPGYRYEAEDFEELE